MPNMTRNEKEVENDLRELELNNIISNLDYSAQVNNYRYTFTYKDSTVKLDYTHSSYGVYVNSWEIYVTAPNILISTERREELKILLNLI